jgi:hypothetical protein
MKLLRRYLSANQKGSMAVLVATSLLMMLGLTGMAMDIGNLYFERTRLQNAVDAAVLAGGQRLPDTSEARALAVQYGSSNFNGITANDVSFANGNRRITVDHTENITPFFMPVFGINSVGVRAVATAELQGASPVFDYAIFSGSEIQQLIFNGGGWNVQGSVHTNDRLILNGGGTTITGAAEAVEGIIENGGGNLIGTRVPNSSVMAMPDYTEDVNAAAEAAGQIYIDDKTLQAGGQYFSQSMYVQNGGITVNGGGWTGASTVMADENIIINGGGITVQPGSQVCFYSRTGDITFNGGGGTFNGILYAPNGTITINGGGNLFNGSVVANRIIFNGGGDRFIRDGNPPVSLPVATGVRLIQ